MNRGEMVETAELENVSEDWDKDSGLDQDEVPRVAELWDFFKLSWLYLLIVGFSLGTGKVCRTKLSKYTDNQPFK